MWGNICKAGKFSFKNLKILINIERSQPDQILEDKSMVQYKYLEMH